MKDLNIYRLIMLGFAIMSLVCLFKADILPFYLTFMFFTLEFLLSFKK